MLVALYVGGRLQNGEDGVQYTKDAAFGFEVNENTTFQELRQLIYEKTVVNPSRYEIEGGFYRVHGSLMDRPFFGRPTSLLNRP